MATNAGMTIDCRQSGRLSPARPSMAARWMSRFVKLYLKRSPIDRGKWWLRRRAAPWLVARLDTGPWIRVSGVADFEWNTLVGEEQAENRTAVLFNQLCETCRVVVDVGANVGYYSLTAASRLGAAGRVIAFEPGPDAAARLRENALLNGLQNLTVVSSAVADQPGTLPLLIGDDSEGSSLFDLAPGAGRQCVEVPVCTLDDYCAATNLSRVDLLKIDAEGAEVRVLRGARRLLSAADAPRVLVEANPLTLAAAGESVASLRSELERANFSISVVESIPWRDVLVENWLATRS